MAAERTVTANMVLNTAGYTAPAEAASKTTAGLAAAQRDAAAAAAQAGAALDAASASTSGSVAAAAAATRSSAELAAAQRDSAAAARQAATASRDASAAETAALKAVTAAQKEAAAAAKDADAAQALSAKAVTDEEKAAAAAATQAAEARVTAATEAVNASRSEADAATAAATAAKEYALAQRDAAAASKEAAASQKASEGILAEVAAAEAAEAKAAQDAAKAREEAYANSGQKMMVAGTALIAMFGLAEKATSDFDHSLSGVAAVANASAQQMDQLRAAALQAGKDTAFTATQAADAEGELVKAGVSVADVLNGGLKGALSLAAAGQLDLADAATISANAMNTFGLKGSDVSHIADVLAAGANKSAADVKTLAYAMQQGGLVAAQTGLSFEDTTAVLAAFADRGLQGADAGTSLKTMLERLSNPTSQAADQMHQLGLTAWDASGKFVGLQNFAGQLQDKLGSLTDAQRNQALATIFGSDAIRGASILYSLGADGMKGYSQAVNDNGAASRMAATEMDNLSGDLKQLKGSLDVALIQSGSGANGVLRDMAQSLTSVVNGFASLPKPVQEAAVGFAGGAGSLLLMVGGLTSIAGKVSATRTTLSELSETATGLKGVLGSVGTFLTGPWGLAIAGAATVVGIFASKHHDAAAAVSDFSEAIKTDGNAIGDTTIKAVAADLAAKGLTDSYGKLGISAGTLTDAAMGNVAAMNQVTVAFGNAVKAAEKSGDVTAVAGLMKQQAAVDAYSSALKDQLKTQQQATAGAQQATEANGQSAAATAQAADAVKALAVETYTAAAAASLQNLAVNAAADSVKAAEAATTSHTAATKTNTSATRDATAVANAQKAETTANTTAAKDAAKAALDQGKAVQDAAKASAAAQAAAAAQKTATDKATASTKASAAATKDATAAGHANTTQANALTTSYNANATAADAAARATDAHSKVLAAQQKQAADAAKANADEAAAQAAAAEAAREAALEHQVGTEALQAMAKSLDAAHTSTGQYTDAVTAEVQAMKDAKNQSTLLKDAMDALNGVHIAAGKAAIDVQQKIADLTKALHDNGTTLDITTDKGRANMTQIYDLATAISTHAQAVVDETGSIDKGNQALDASRDEFDKVLKSAGLSTTQIQQFNDTLLKTPSMIPITVSADTSKALAAINALREKAGEPLIIGGTSVKAMATGGLISGPGTETSDSIPIMASRGEFVVTAAAARAVGVDTLNRINAAGAGGTIVRPHLVQNVGGTTPQPSRTAGAGLHIEHYYEDSGGNAQRTANELGWLLGARGTAF